MGAVARVMMRLVALSTGHAGEFSVGGTVGILLAFAIIAAPGALLAALWRGRGRSALLVLGAGLLAFVATGIARSDLGNVDDLSAWQWVGVALAGLGVFASILALPVLTFRLIARWSGRRTSAAPLADAPSAAAPA